MAVFEEAYQLTSIQEGGYSNHPDDKGGETYRGISRLHWPQWPGWSIVDRLKAKTSDSKKMHNLLITNSGLTKGLESFYKKEFWDKLACVHLPQKIANELFDTSVNMGHSYGVSCLQNALNKLNRNQKDYVDIHVDGQIGTQTLNATESYFKTARFSTRNKDKLINWLLKWMNYYQLCRYDRITEKNPDQEIFIPGWTNRG
ncbi:hypothetical protein L3073_17585 [Ancylomarina sp. DW003]|nr:glycosyl hydrolase 108 family protein [Ancylomarina sp. DW003]MDE5424031.1 hypothetical protein [Ancylomarina sp. DW003]